ncbi:hypothetical protein LGZ99_02095 [Photorhabdus temperata]|nr:hypothetical protein [Photorhabdus temperata]
MLTSQNNLKLNELIEYISILVWHFKIKYSDDFDLLT